MPNVVGVRFKEAGKIYYFEPGGDSVETGSTVIVETARGQEAGKVVIATRDVAESELVTPLKKVIRKAGDADLKRIEENRVKEAAAFEKCREKITEHRLQMKLVSVEYTFDRNKIVFFFTSDDRVDFRELVKDLASVFKTRIELRQIGVRDEAKHKGGIGPCGRAFCCTTFLEEFEPVSIRMAKGQNLSLNPTKISGVCGRLMCCLRYEASCYESRSPGVPRQGDSVLTPDGPGTAIDFNRKKKTVSVKLSGGSTRQYPVEEVDIQE